MKRIFNLSTKSRDPAAAGTFASFKKTAGFTLLEVLMYLGLFSMLLVVLLQLFTAILDVQFSSEATSQVLQDGRYLLARFSYDVQRASAVVVPASAGIQTTTLQLVISGQSYTYAVSNGVLQLTTPTGTDALTSADTSIGNMTFTRYGTSSDNAISLAFQLTGKTARRGGMQTETFQTTIATRSAGN